LKATIAHFLLIAAVAAGSLGITRADDTVAMGVGAVYTITNDAAGNAIAVYTRMPDGSLKRAGTVSTGGAGSGGGLGSQGSVALSDDGHWLLAVNAGSNEISVLQVMNGSVSAVSRIASGGVMPVSVTISDYTVFVLNAGGAPNIRGFWLNDDGTLKMNPAWSRNLTGMAPAEVSFSPDGGALVVTEKGSDRLESFTFDGVNLSDAQVRASYGQTPFGFAFDRRDHIIVSEAFGGAAGQSAASSYLVDENGGLRLVTGSLQTGQSAICWIAISWNGKYAFTANTGSDTISTLSIGRDGSLRLVSAISGRTGTGGKPGDMALSRDGRFLYTLNPGNGTITGFRVQGNGSLQPAGVTTGLPSSVNGLAAQ
jgi:6-phosphogluconolactonase